MDLFILWAARSCSWIILLFTALGAFYLLTNSITQTQSSAWDSWRRKMPVRKAVTGDARSMVPLAVLLCTSFAAVGFAYGVFGQLTGQTFFHTNNPVDCFYQAIVPQDNQE